MVEDKKLPQERKIHLLKVAGWPHAQSRYQPCHQPQKRRVRAFLDCHFRFHCVFEKISRWVLRTVGWRDLLSGTFKTFAIKYISTFRNSIASVWSVMQMKRHIKDIRMQIVFTLYFAYESGHFLVGKCLMVSLNEFWCVYYSEYCCL